MHAEPLEIEMANYCGHGNRIGSAAGGEHLCGDCENGVPAPEPMDLEEDYDFEPEATTPVPPKAPARELFLYSTSTKDMYLVLGSVNYFLDDTPFLLLRNTRTWEIRAEMADNLRDDNGIKHVWWRAVCSHGYGQRDSCPGCDAEQVDEAFKRLKVLEDQRAAVMALRSHDDRARLRRKVRMVDELESTDKQLGRALELIRQLVDIVNEVPTWQLAELGVYSGAGDTVSRATRFLGQFDTDLG